MILDIQDKYNEIEQDIVANQEFVFRMQNYYSRKYSKDSDRLNDVNIGLFLDDRFNPVVQIFIRNKTGYIRKHILFNFEGTKVRKIATINEYYEEEYYN